MDGLRPGPRQEATRAALAIACGLCLLAEAALMAGGYRTLVTFKDDANVVPAPAGSGPAPEERPPARRARRVLLAILDGLRLDTSRELPFLRELARRGVDAEAVAEYPSVSLPNYASLVTGAPPRATGILNNNHVGPFPFDSILRRARAAGLRTAVVGPPSCGVERLDGPFLDRIVELVPSPSLPPGDLVVFLTVGADVAGHAFGGASSEYRDAALVADRQLRALAVALDLARDAVVVTADHGRVDFGGHGGLEPEELRVPLVLAGTGVRPGATPTSARVTDVAPTVAALLGLPPPRDATGRVLVELLELDAGEASGAALADARRREAIEGRLESWRVAHAAGARRVRHARLAMLAAAILAALALLRMASSSGATPLDRSAIVAGSALPSLAALLALSSHRFRLSPAYGPRRVNIEHDVVMYAAILALLAVVALLLARHPPGSLARLRWRAAAAQVGAVIGLALLGATRTLLWPPFDGGLPTPAQVALVPMACATVVCSAAVQGALLVADALLVARRRRTRARLPSRSCLEEPVLP